MQSVELAALAKVHAKLNNAHVRRTMSSALQNVIKLVHVAKIKNISNTHMYRFLSSASVHSILLFQYVQISLA